MSTTPTAQPPQAPSSAQHYGHSKKSSTALPSRPTTPLRSVSRTSLRASQTTPLSSSYHLHNSSRVIANDFPLAGLEPTFAELSDSMADLEANFMHLQLLNESMGRFNENFAAFLYGLNMTAFCVDFPEAPIPQSFARHGSNTTQLQDSPFRDAAAAAAAAPTRGQPPLGNDAAPDATFLTTDTSFVENPPISSRPTSKYPGAQPSVATSKQAAAYSRGGASSRSRGGSGGGVGGSSSRGRGSRLPSGVGRGASRGSTRGRGTAVR